MKQFTQAGDTIIEVLLAITVFSVIAVGALTVMNQGTNSTQRTLEVSIVKQQIDSQAEALRAAYQNELAKHSDGGDDTWKFITNHADASPVDVTATACPTNYGNSFILNARTGETTGPTPIKTMDDVNAPPHAQVMYTGESLISSYGIWIEKTVVNNFTVGSGPKAYNFRIRACWYGSGTNVPMQLQTVVRLYDPGASLTAAPLAISPLASPSSVDNAAVAQQAVSPGSGPTVTPTRYYYAANFVVSNNTISPGNIAGCTWYWDDNSVPGGENIADPNQCVSGATISHNFKNDIHMKNFETTYPFPVACKPGTIDGATGAGIYTYTVFMVIHKVGGANVTTPSIDVSRPVCGA